MKYLSLVVCVWAATAATTIAAETGPERLETLVAQWVDLEKQADRLRHDWQNKQLVLQQRLSLLQLEQKNLKEQLKKHTGVQDRVQQHRAELAAEQTRLEQNQQLLMTALQNTATAVASIQPRLPEPLAKHWQEKLAGLGVSESPESSSVRLDNYLGLLKSLDEFENKVTLHQSLMDIDGNQVLVDQIYLGVGQGWYVSRDGSRAGIGHAGVESWQWRADNSLAGQLRDVVTALQHPEKSQILDINIDLNRSER